MKKIVAILAGDPDSINSELIAKVWKKKQKFKNINIFIIGNFNLLSRQFSILNLKINIKKILNLDFSRAETCKKTSLLLSSSRVIKPYPFFELNHLTLPNGIIFSCNFWEAIFYFLDVEIF